MEPAEPGQAGLGDGPVAVSETTGDMFAPRPSRVCPAR